MRVGLLTREERTRWSKERSHSGPQIRCCRCGSRMVACRILRYTGPTRDVSLRVQQRMLEMTEEQREAEERKKKVRAELRETFRDPRTGQYGRWET